MTDPTLTNPDSCFYVDGEVSRSHIEACEESGDTPEPNLDDYPLRELRIGVADRLSYHGMRFLRITEDDGKLVIQMIEDDDREPSRPVGHPIIIDARQELALLPEHKQTSDAARS